MTLLTEKHTANTTIEEDDVVLFNKLRSATTNEERNDTFNIIYDKYNTFAKYLVGYHFPNYAQQCNTARISHNDVYTEASFALYKAIETFNIEKGTFKIYLSRCVKNALIDIFHKRMKTDTRNTNYASDMEEYNDSVGDNIRKSEYSDVVVKLTLADLIEKSKRTMTEEDIVILKLYILDGFTQAEIRKKLGINKARASRKLRKAIMTIQRRYSVDERLEVESYVGLR